MKLFYIENTVNELNRRISGYFSTLDAAQDALKNCEDWYCSKGTGKIYQVDMDTLNPEHILVCKDGVLINLDYPSQNRQEKTPLSVTDLISRATAISEQSKSLADDLGKVKIGFEMAE